MKRKIAGSLFIWICCLTMGMGSMGEQASTKTPEPDKNFLATVVDQDDVSMELEKFSIDGKTYITGKMGKADLSIDFEKIRSILFVVKEDSITARVILEGQKEVEMTVVPAVPCFGISSFADVRIAARDIKKIVLHGIKQTN
jgi:hypothetical protein